LRQIKPPRLGPKLRQGFDAPKQVIFPVPIRQASDDLANVCNDQVPERRYDNQRWGCAPGKGCHVRCSV